MAAKKIDRPSFSPDGGRVLTYGLDGPFPNGRILVLDANNGHEVAGFTGLEAGFSPNGASIVTMQPGERVARVFDAATGTPTLVLEGHGDVLTTATYSRDGTRILTASRDGTARLWDAKTGEKKAILKAHKEGIRRAVLNRDRSRIVTVSDDGNTVRLCNAETGEEIEILKGHTGKVYGATFSTDSTRIVTASEDYTARLWDAKTGKPIRTFDGHANWVYSATFSPDDRRVLTASRDATARLWDASLGDELTRYEGVGESAEGVHGAEFSPDGTQVLVRGYLEKLRLLAAGGYELPQTIPSSVPAAPHGKRIVVDSDEGAWVEDAESGRKLVNLEADPDVIYGTALSPDGKRAAVTYDSTVRLFDASTGKDVVSLTHERQSRPCASFSSDGMQIVTVAWPIARVWDAVKGIETARFGGDKVLAVGCSVFSPDGGKVATIINDGTVRLWNTTTGGEIVKYEGGSQTDTVEFSKNGKRLLTAYDPDRSARIWDTESGVQIAALGQIGRDSEFVKSATFSADETQVVATTYQGILVWRNYASTGDLIRSAKDTVGRCLTREERTQFHLSATPPRWCYSMKKLRHVPAAIDAANSHQQERGPPWRVIRSPRRRTCWS